MPKKISAGLLQYNVIQGKLRVFLVHPAGPFFKNKDLGSWSIPKGLVDPGEDKYKAAQREFEEEVGVKPVLKNVIELGTQKGPKKDITAWAFEGKHKFIKSNTFELEWPPKSGKMQTFPEVDKGQLFDIPTALKKVNRHQADLIHTLVDKLKSHNFQKEREESRIEKYKRLVESQPKEIKKQMLWDFYKLNGRML